MNRQRKPIFWILYYPTAKQYRLFLDETRAKEVYKEAREGGETAYLFVEDTSVER